MIIKRCIAILISTTILLICTGYNNQSVEADTTRMYHIAKTDSWILIPDQYTLFTREMDESADALKKRGLSKNDLVSFLDAYGAEFVAITPDGNMEVMLQFKKTGFDSDNLISQSEGAISSYAEGLQIGLGAEQYELIENNNMMWVKLAYSHPVAGQSTPADYVRYTTIANGWDIYLWGASYNGKLTPQNLQELQGMWNSFFFSKYDNTSTMKEYGPNASPNFSKITSIKNFVIALFITMLAYGSFPLIFAEVRKKHISKRKYNILCYGINFFVSLVFSIANSGSSAMGLPYLIWTWTFSTLGLKILKRKDIVDESQDLTTENKRNRGISVSHESINVEKKSIDTSKIAQVKHCTRCNNKLQGDDTFCSRCGKKVIADTQEQYEIVASFSKAKEQ